MTDTPEARRPEAPDPGPDPAAADDSRTGAAEAANPTPPPAADAGTAAYTAAEPDPFAPAPVRLRTRWINPRRRWATWLIAAGAAVVVFIGGAATGFGIAHNNDGPWSGRFHAWTDRGDMPGPDGMQRPGMMQRLGPGMMQFPGNGQRPGWRGGQDDDDSPGGSSTAPSSSTAPNSSPSTSPTPSTS